MGFYLEWNLNKDWLLVIKSTVQADPITRKETNHCAKLLKKYSESDGIGVFAYKQFWVWSHFDDADDKDPFKAIKIKEFKEIDMREVERDETQEEFAKREERNR